MPTRPVPRPSDLELQVLSVLWRLGQATARQVLGAMPDGKRRAYTTVLSVMQVMEKKGLLERSTEGHAHRWRPAVTRRQVLGPLMRQLVRNVFGGSRAAAVQQLLGDADLDDAEITAIKSVLAERRRGQERKSK
ncbi:MAG: BlaI/MecI/CopY family transcriptional regulator [Candidatus Sumerlaeia bacterium]